MNISATFIHRPIATVLLMAGLLLGGLVTYRLLPVASLPNVNFPTISVTAKLPGADPQTMASSVATPLEQQFSQIPGLTQLTSASALGYTQLTVQFELSRDIDTAATDVLAAINAATPYLPVGIPYPPTIRKVNPADTPILVLGLTSDTLPLTTVDAFTENILVPKASQISGVGLIGIGGQQKPAIRVQVDPQALADRGIGLEDVRNVLMQANVDQPKGTLNSPQQTFTLGTNDQLLKPDAYKDLIVAYRNGAPVLVHDIGNVIEASENNQIGAFVNKKAAILLAIQRQPGANVRNRGPHQIPAAAAAGLAAARYQAGYPVGPDPDHPRLRFRRAIHAAADGGACGDGHLHLSAQFLGHRDSRHHRAIVANRYVRRPLRTGVQPGQPLPDGAVDRDRLRGRRRSRRYREHRPPSRGRAKPDGSGSQGLK